MHALTHLQMEGQRCLAAGTGQCHGVDSAVLTVPENAGSEAGVTADRAM